MTLLDPTDPARLRVRDLTVDRGGRRVLDGVSFAAREGEVFGFLGPNGAGKTTLFHVLTGLLAPLSGSVELDGKPLGEAGRASKTRTGVVFQQPALDPHLTGRQNLSLAARLYGVPRRTARERICSLLEQVELTDRADEPVSRLSGGMRRRIELARALVHAPSILILDEPTAGLDQRALVKIWEHLLSLRKERGVTLVLNTHNPEEAEKCDRLAILDRGRIVACDTPDRLKERVRGDLIILETDSAQEVASAISRRFGANARVVNGKVYLERDRAHELIPRLVESFPERTLRSVGIRQVRLGEVFLELTGRELTSPGAEEGE